MKRITLTAAAVAAAAIALAACGSSGGGSGSGGGSSANTPTTKVNFTGAPIKIGVIAETSKVTALGNAQPETVEATQAAIDAINAAGGINGSEVKLDACDGQGDPNVAADCARKLVADGVVATVGDDTTSGQQLNSVLKSAGIPRVGPLALSAAEFNDSNSYPLSGGAVVMFEGAAIDAAQNGAKSAFIVYTETEGSGIVPSLIQPVLTSHGVDYKGKIGIPPGSPDLSSYVAKAISSGADTVITTFGPELTQQFGQTAIQLGAKFRIATVAEALSDAVVKKLGANSDLVKNALLVSPYPPVADNSIAAVKLFNDQLDAAQKAGAKHLGDDTRPHIFNSWLAGYAFGQIAKTISGPVTKESLTTAMNNAKDVDLGGAIPAWTPSKSGGMFARVSNGSAWFVKIVDGKQQLDPTTPQEVVATK
jgi:ABC-type branched-subunit amino acid transport system substrate-binding protein